MLLPRCLRPLAAGLCLAGIVSFLSAEPVEVYPAKANSLSLNGTWEFAYRAGPLTDAAPAALAPIAVPGHWELQGFAEPKYGKELVEALQFPVARYGDGRKGGGRGVCERA